MKDDRSFLNNIEFYFKIARKLLMTIALFLMN